MNKKIILFTMLLTGLLLGASQLSAQTFTGSVGALIPGNTDGYYCNNAAVSTVNIGMPGRIGVNYEIDRVSIDVTHEFPAEMQLSLVSPRGNIINLAIGQGGTLDNAYENTVFRDGGDNISNSVTPFDSGSGYEPQGNTFADQFMNEKVAGDWQLEICDLANNANGGVINSFSITLNPLAPADPDPIYDIQVSATNNFNVNLNSDCQAMLVPSQILNGNFDLDGDGNTPPDEAYIIEVQDENPCNGPIIDGCGDFEVWISAADTMPQVEEGFDGCSMMNILPFTAIPLPSTGQFADVAVTADTIALTTLGGSSLSTPVIAGVGYTFNRSGTAGFRFNFENAPLGIFDMDIVLVSFDGTETPIPNTVFSVNGTYTFAQPIEVEPGDRLQIQLENPDGSSQPGDVASVAKIFDFFFIPTVAESTIIGTSLPLFGFVNAVDATPAEFISVPTQSGVLFTSQLSDVIISGLSPAISRTYRVDGQTGAILNNSLDPIILERLNLAGGLPVVFDGCSDVDIMINDQITSAGECNDIIVTRTFVATDDPDCLSLEGSNPVFATQQIVFSRPNLTNVNPPSPVVEVSCEDFSGNANPLPQLSDFPTLTTASGLIFLNQTVGNVAATFEDGQRIITCNNTYKFVRTYTVIDWCDIDTIAVFTQLVKVGDFDAPMITPPVQDLDFDGMPDTGPIFFTTNAANCTAFFDVTSGVTLDDDCSDEATITLNGFIYPDGDLDAFPLGPFNATDLATNIPKGIHLLRYVAEDECGNSDTLDIQVEVGDRTTPTAICEDGLNVSLGGNGTAVLMAVDVNAASIDDCSGTDLLYEIAIVDEDNNPLTPWMSSLTLDCSNIGSIRVGLRVTDDGDMDGIFEPGTDDNSNVCFAIIMIDDEANPVCIAPTSQLIACADLQNNFPADLEAAFAADPEETIALLNATFGAPTGVDNCPGLTITQTVVDNRTDCGTGTILRSFGVEDAQGFTALPNCNQTIQIAGSHNYSVVFPSDQNAVGCVQPSFDDVTIIEGSCDMVTMGMTVDTFEATANECRLIRITYEVLNLCEYNTTAPAYIIPRDADNDGIVGEEIVLHVTPGVNSASTADDQAFLDRDLNRNNGNTIANLDTGDGGLVPGSNPFGYGQDASRGFFTYTQFISVIDNVAPQVAINSADTLAMDITGDCIADLDVNFSITDECSMDDVSFSVDVDIFINDADQNGLFTLNEFIPSYTLNASNINDLGSGAFLARLESLPIGRHAIRIFANDGCGNGSARLLVFRAQDMVAATPICINGLTATLAPDEMGGGIAQVTAETFVVDDNTTDCSGPVNYAIYRIPDASVPGFTPNVNDTLLTVTCDEVGPVGVRIYSIDANGIFDFCETSLLVQVFNPDICNPPANDLNGTIAGTVSTPQYVNQEGVEVNITAQVMGEFITYTNQNGNYVFQNLMDGDDYTIEPEANPAVNLANVTTGDLILISRHILALEDFSSPYQYVAADVNGDRTVNILDMIAIRRVILGLANDYPATNSWEFVSSAHDFGNDPNDYLDNSLMTVYNVNNLEGAMLSANFMAIEMGNVSAAIETESDLVDDQGESRSVAVLQVPQLSLQADRYFDIQIPQPTHLLGFQTTLEMDADLELVSIEYGTATEGDFNLSYAENGIIGIAHVNQQLGDTDSGSPLFTLRLRAHRDAQLEDLLQLSDRLVITEAYVDDAGRPSVTDLALDFQAEAANTTSIGVEQFRVEQNYPNPFRERTNIDYYLPTAGEVELMVHDNQGRTILLKRVDGVAGRNQLRIERSELGEISGLLHYTIASKDGTLTRQMLLVR